MICRTLNNGRGCSHFHPQFGCDVYNRGGMRFRDRQGYCPIPDGPNKKKTTSVQKVRTGQQKQKKK